MNAQSKAAAKKARAKLLRDLVAKYNVKGGSSTSAPQSNPPPSSQNPSPK